MIILLLNLVALIALVITLFKLGSFEKSTNFQIRKIENDLFETKQLLHQEREEKIIENIKRILEV